MTSGQTETGEITQATRDARINASNRLWDAFNAWMDNYGYKSLSEALRAAMIKVTNFEPENQEKSSLN